MDFRVEGLGGAGAYPANRDGRDDRLADFAQDRCGDTARPNAWHVMVLSDLTGADDRCPGATDDEALGLMGRWKAAESWAAARKLGLVREMIRRRAVPEKGMASAGLPWEWERDLEHEVAAQLRVSLVAAGKLLEPHLPHPRLAPVDHPIRPHLHPRTLAIPRLTRVAGGYPIAARACWTCWRSSAPRPGAAR